MHFIANSSRCDIWRPPHGHSSPQNGSRRIEKLTANPKWPEITDNLAPGQQPNDRPDLIARVFHLKVKQLILELQVENIMMHSPCGHDKSDAACMQGGRV